VDSGKLRDYLGVTDVNYAGVRSPLAIVVSAVTQNQPVRVE